MPPRGSNSARHSRPAASEVVAVFAGRLGLGRGTALSAALLMLDDGHGCGNEFHAPIAAVGSGVQFAVVVEVVLTVELVLPAELAVEFVGSLSVVGLLVTLEMFIAAEGLVAAWVVALAHGSTDDINPSSVGLARPFPGGSDLCTLELSSLALGLVQHHLALGPHVVGRANGL